MKLKDEINALLEITRGTKAEAHDKAIDYQEDDHLPMEHRFYVYGVQTGMEKGLEMALELIEMGAKL
jgi:hypothetical protein